MSFFTHLILLYNNLNDKLILTLNSQISPFISSILVLDNIFDYKKFYILFAIIFVCVKLLLKDKNTATKKAIFEYYYNLSINFFISGLVVLSLKTLIDAVRPVCKNIILANPDVITNITSNLYCNQSFPSGHTSFAVIFSLVTFRYCNKFFKFILCLLVCAVSLSRIMIGAHSIIDIVGALVINFIIVNINHKFFTKFSSYIFNKYQKYFIHIL